jgi:hypothetical protein
VSGSRSRSRAANEQHEVANQEQQTSGVLNRRQAVAVYDDLFPARQLKRQYARRAFCAKVPLLATASSAALPQARQSQL